MHILRTCWRSARLTAAFACYGFLAQSLRVHLRQRTCCILLSRGCHWRKVRWITEVSQLSINILHLSWAEAWRATAGLEAGRSTSKTWGSTEARRSASRGESSCENVSSCNCTSMHATYAVHPGVLRIQVGHQRMAVRRTQRQVLQRREWVQSGQLAAHVLLVERRLVQQRALQQSKAQTLLPVAQQGRRVVVHRRTAR